MDKAAANIRTSFEDMYFQILRAERLGQRQLSLVCYFYMKLPERFPEVAVLVSSPCNNIWIQVQLQHIPTSTCQFLNF